MGKKLTLEDTINVGRNKRIPVSQLTKLELFDFIKKGIDLLKENDFLLILGKGHEEAIIVKDKKIPFNDHKVVEEILKKVEVR